MHATDSKPLYIVSGLPRTGTSLMMQMLEAGGLPVVTDGLRAADESNPRGYYECERVKELPKDAFWLEELSGQALKIVSTLLKHLPADLECKIVYMERPIKQVLASQKRMLERNGFGTTAKIDAALGQAFSVQSQHTKKELKARCGIDLFEVSYPALIEESDAVVKQVRQFLECDLDESAMTACVQKSLYRHRSVD